MAVQTNDEIKGTEKEFLDLFNHLCYSRTACANAKGYEALAMMKQRMRG